MIGEQESRRTTASGAPANFPSNVQKVWPDTAEEPVAARQTLYHHRDGEPAIAEVEVEVEAAIFEDFLGISLAFLEAHREWSPGRAELAVLSMVRMCWILSIAAVSER